MTMQRKTAATTMVAVAAAIAAIALLTKATGQPTQRAVATSSASCNVPKTSAEPSRQAFEDVQTVARHFADELGRFKDENQTMSPAELLAQAHADSSYPIPTLADPGKKLDAETIYARTKAGVVVVGGIFKCTKCKNWHAQCAGGFVVGQDGLILTNLHTVEACGKLEAMGAMTEDGRVFPVKAVLASSRLNDLALLKVQAAHLRPLPVSADVSVGATVYCLSHPTLPNGKANCFYTFSQGIVCGKFIIDGEQRKPLPVLAITADYGLGASGGPILNDHGAVVAIACQAVPLLQREKEKNTQMVWKFARPSCSILALLDKSATGRKSTAAENSLVIARTAAKAAPSVQNAEPKPSASGAVTFELRPCEQPSVGYYRPASVQLTEKPFKQPKAEPRYQSKKPLYGVLQLGDAADNRFLVAVDEPDGGQPKIYIDRHGDGDLTNSGPGDWDRSNGPTCFAGNVLIDVPYPTGKIPYNFCFYRMKSRMPDRLFYYRNGGREGEVVLDGKHYRVLVLDDNADGRFDDLQNGSFIIDLNQDNKLDATTDSAEYFQLNEPFNVHGKVWEVASMTADGLHIALQPSRAEVAIKPYLDPGCPAPEFVGKGLDGQTIDLQAEATKGKYVLLDFWASWCGPCRGEFLTLRRLYARYKDHGLTIIGVNLDSDLAPAVNAAEQAQLLYPHIFDGQGWKNAVARLYRVHGIPQVYLLDSQLKIVGKQLRGVALEQRLRELLGPGDEEAAQAVDQSRQTAKEPGK
jgi:thiol-disulfide isomerase/thioredoxin/S1-C subfamily serine protease